MSEPDGSELTPTFYGGYDEVHAFLNDKEVIDFITAFIIDFMNKQEENP